MKKFLKENQNYILFLIFAGLVLIFWARVLVAQFCISLATQNLHTTQDRTRCASYFGWQVDKTSETHETIYIPEEFDNVYARYNALQKLSGFDLSAYKGKGVTRYTYRVLNFPNGDHEAFLNLLVYNGTLIGGDCMTVALDGIMLPLDRRSIP